MKIRWILVTMIVVIVYVGGCATQSELTQKEKDRMAREMERENRKQSQAQEKMMRPTTQGGMGGQRQGSR
jgi:hypothetical protein